jgi:hypothetical protein
MTEQELMTMIKASTLDALLNNEAMQDRMPDLKEEVNLLIANLFEQNRHLIDDYNPFQAILNKIQ